MGDHVKSRTEFVSRGVTLNSLKEELYSLNMRLRLAMQTSDISEQESLQKQIDELLADIDCIGSGSRSRFSSGQADTETAPP